MYPKLHPKSLKNLFKFVEKVGLKTNRFFYRFLLAIWRQTGPKMDPKWH